MHLLRRKLSELEFLKLSIPYEQVWFYCTYKIVKNTQMYSVLTGTPSLKNISCYFIRNYENFPFKIGFCYILVTDFILLEIKMKAKFI